MKTTYYTIAGNAGSYTDIPCTIFCRKMQIREVRKADGSPLVYQGLRAKFADDRSGVPYATVEYPDTAASDITIVHPAMAGNGCSPVIGMPAMNSAAAYAGGTTYAAGDTVLSGGMVYGSLIDSNAGNTPASSPTQWRLIPNYRPADIPVKLLSDTATGTFVEVTEYE